MDEIPNFENLLNENLSKYKNSKNVNILEINQKSNNFFNFINKFFNKHQCSYHNLKNDISNDGEKSSINVIIKLIEFSNELKQFDIIYLNTNFPIYNIIFVMEELFKLLKIDGIFIYNNYQFYDYAIKINIDTFIQIKMNEIKMKCVDSLIIFKKNNNLKNFSKKDLEIHHLIKNVSTFYPEIDLSKDIKNDLIFDLKFEKINKKLLINKKTSFKELNKLSNKYNKLYFSDELTRIKLKSLDNQVFSRNRPLIREKFNIFYKKFYKDAIDPIRFHHFYSFLDLNLKYSLAKKDYAKYEMLNNIHFPNKKNIIYLHTIHNLSLKYNKIVHPYIFFNAFSEYKKSNKKLKEFKNILTHKPKTIVKKTNLFTLSEHTKKIKKLDDFEQISHMLPYEYENKNNNVNLSKPTRRIAFELKTTKDLEYVKTKMDKYKIKSFDVMKLDAFFDTSKFTYPKSEYYIHLLFNNIVFLLNYQTKGGSTTLQTFGCYDEIYVDFIQILRKYYTNVRLKYHIWTTMDKIDITYSIICENFRGIQKNELEQFNNMMNILHDNNSNLGKVKQKISNILNHKSYMKNEKQQLIKKIKDFNQIIIDDAIFKFNYYFKLYDYFFKSKSKNMVVLKKNLLSKQINDYIILLTRMNLLEYRKYF